MMWLPIVLTLGVLFFVGVAVVKTGDIGMSWLTLVGCVSFALAMTVGFSITYFASPTADDWRTSLVVRAVWQIASSVLLAVACLREAKGAGRLGLGSVWGLAGVILVLGPVAAMNPLRDLAEGPITVRLEKFDVEKTSGGARGGAKIFSTLEARAEDGSERDVSSAGWEATTAEDAIGRCNKDDEVDLIMLDHMNRVIEARCHGK